MKIAAAVSAVVALASLVPSVSSASEHRARPCDWHGRCWGPSVRFYGPGVTVYGGYPYRYYAPYYGPAVSFSVNPAPAPASSRADDLAVDVQRALRRDGYYRGDIDGDVGPETRAAIRQFQYDHHLEVTGRIDRALVRSLGIE